ncbi:MAG: GNAT family N-acetyltransferase, partial [Acutalibacteraceae bacterium]
MKITVKQLDKNSFPDALAVRYAVFCDEQGYARDYERDEYDVITDIDAPGGTADHPLCGTVHFAAYDEDKAIPVGAGRIIFGSGEFPCKIGRIAVLKEYRRFGVGKLIMNELIAFAKQKGASEIVLD